MDGEGYPSSNPPNPFMADFTLGPGQTWSGYDRYIWLSGEVEIPHDFVGKVTGLFDFGETGGGGNSGFESLFYLNGTLYQGVDSNHIEVLLGDICPGDKVLLQFRLWSGLIGGGEPRDNFYVIRQMELEVLDEATDRFYFLMKNLLDAHKTLEEHSPYKT